MKLGVFDSGVGGLSVLHEIRSQLPHQKLLYVADSGHAPYGGKSADFIQTRALTISHFLVEQGAQAIVVACNTATAAAIQLLRDRIQVPIIGMEPAVKPAAAATRSGVVGVLATVGTLQSAKFAALLDRFASDITVVTQGCPGLVEQIEAGNLDGSITRQLVERYCAPLLSAGADTIVLGCTHYPFLRPMIQEVVGEGVTLIDTGAAVARQTQRVLAEHHLTPTGRDHGTVHFWTSSNPATMAPIMRRLWRQPVPVLSLPETLLLAK